MTVRSRDIVSNYTVVAQTVKNSFNFWENKNLLIALTHFSAFDIITNGQSCFLKVDFNNKNGYFLSSEGGNLYVKNSGS
ncbi:hypothetical protein NRIC_13570 [Enterococcus florum]|uniref:Uncharacterized protein n=1 Tax=Enterococcus florum TaxID=2480627 RepID=A0A4P5P7K5_9ENTE|nr:hypothetical protein NRIC_13570 [Enterococcus florum]